VYSNYIHSNALRKGDKVLLGAPFGMFCNPEGEVESKGKNIAFAAGGMGVTSVISMLEAFGPRVRAGVVVNRTHARSPFQAQLEKASDTDVRFFATREHWKSGCSSSHSSKRPDMHDQAKFLVDRTGVDGNYFICGPTNFMQATEQALRREGAKNIFNNVYGTGTVETNVASEKASAIIKCPMA
jgi:ferredoxin-NADP reductase